MTNEDPWSAAARVEAERETAEFRQRASRAEFERWLLEAQGLVPIWDSDRNCYNQFAAHLAFKAWCAAPRIGSITGHGNANTAADRPSAIKAGEAAASDGDSACPAVPAPADSLWCVHIIGPDDVYAAPNEAEAKRAAAWMTKFWAELNPEDAALRVVGFEAIPWPHSPESHAESVGDFYIEIGISPPESPQPDPRTLPIDDVRCES